MTTKYDAQRARANLSVTRDQIARGAVPGRDHAAREQRKQERLAAARKAHAASKGQKAAGAAAARGSAPEASAAPAAVAEPATPGAEKPRD
jgi:hypothetical protein